MDLPAADTSREVREHGVSADTNTKLSEAERDLVGRAYAHAEFIGKLARLAVERTENADLRKFGEKLVTGNETFMANLTAWAERRGIDLEAHPTQRSSAPGAAIGGAGRTDNIGQTRSPGHPGTPTEQIPREARERDTTTPRGPQAMPADSAAAGEQEKEAGVDASVVQRQEVRLRKLLDHRGTEFDRELLGTLLDAQGALIGDCERLAEVGDDAELANLARTELEPLQARRDETLRLHERLEN